MMNLFALQAANVWLGLVLAIVLFAGLLVPYLVEEIQRGKIALGSRVPISSGNTRSGYRGNPTPGRSHSAPPLDHGTLSLRSFHVVFISLSIVLAAGIGTWGLFHDQVLVGVLAFGGALLLVAYQRYFLRKAENAHLE